MTGTDGNSGSFGYPKKKEPNKNQKTLLKIATDEKALFGIKVLKYYPDGKCEPDETGWLRVKLRHVKKLIDILES